jgi:hypothetical protein
MFARLMLSSVLTCGLLLAPLAAEAGAAKRGMLKGRTAQGHKITLKMQGGKAFKLLSFNADLDCRDGTELLLEEGGFLSTPLRPNGSFKDVQYGDTDTVWFRGRVTDNAVILDVGFKSEGSVPLDEFKDPQSLKEGDEVEVFLEHLEDQEGAVVLSKKKADFMRVWEKIRVAHESDQPVEGTLVKKIKGGVVVNLMGVDAFLPGSQIALRRVPNIDELLGQTYEFKSIKLNKGATTIVFKSLMKHKLVDERAAMPGEASWREADGNRFALVIGEAGLAALGVEKPDVANQVSAQE